MTHRDDEEVARIARDDKVIDLLGRWRDQNRRNTDAFDFWTAAQEEVAKEQDKSTDRMGLVLMVMFALGVCGYSASIGLAVYSVMWALYVSMAAGALTISTVVLACVCPVRK